MFRLRLGNHDGREMLRFVWVSLQRSPLMMFSVIVRCSRDNILNGCRRCATNSTSFSMKGPTVVHKSTGRCNSTLFRVQHPNYAWWLVVLGKDFMNLKQRHHDLYAAFRRRIFALDEHTVSAPWRRTFTCASMHRRGISHYTLQRLINTLYQGLWWLLQS